MSKPILNLVGSEASIKSSSEVPEDLQKSSVVSQPLDRKSASPKKESEAADDVQGQQNISHEKLKTSEEPKITDEKVISNYVVPQLKTSNLAPI